MRRAKDLLVAEKSGHFAATLTRQLFRFRSPQNMSSPADDFDGLGLLYGRFSRSDCRRGTIICSILTAYSYGWGARGLCLFTGGQTLLRRRCAAKMPADLRRTHAPTPLTTPAWLNASLAEQSNALARTNK